jgi:hypothetical protein
MLFGNKSTFAIESELSRREPGWLFAHFRLWANHHAIGDFTENAVLRGCVEYLAEFLGAENLAFDARLVDKPIEEVFKCVFEQEIITCYPNETLDDAYERWSVEFKSTACIIENARNRFHLDSAGMSAFMDKVNVILVDNGDGRGRLIWRELQTMQLQEAWFPLTAFFEASNQFLAWGNSELEQ